MCVRAQACPTLCDPMDCSLPGSSVNGIFQARILEWVAISSSRGSSRPRDRTHIFYIYLIGRWIFNHCATWGWGKYLLSSSLRSLPSHRIEGTWAPNQHGPPSTYRQEHPYWTVKKARNRLLICYNSKCYPTSYRKHNV